MPENITKEILEEVMEALPSQLSDAEIYALLMTIMESYTDTSGAVGIFLQCLANAGDIDLHRSRGPMQ